MASRFESASSTLRRDPAHLRVRDRAVLRILNRAGAATSAQLTVLAYGNRRLAQRRLERLWRFGLLERSRQPPAASQAGAPYAYRLSAACRRRLGAPRPRSRGPGYLGHTLDAVDAVCALVRTPARDGGSIVQLWLPERLAARILAPGPEPDAIVVLADDAGSGVLCLEIDEGSQHLAPIRAKLEAYRRALAGRAGWHVVFVVPGPARASWLARLAGSLELAGLSLWSMPRAVLAGSGADARLTGLRPRAASRTVRELLVDPTPRRSPTPVGSRAWIELLGTGGGEEADDLLR